MERLARISLVVAFSCGITAGAAEPVVPVDPSKVDPSRHADTASLLLARMGGRWLHVVSCDARCDIHLWDAKTCKLLRQIVAHKSSLCEEVRFAPSGKEFASCGLDGRICRWQTETGKLIDELKPRTTLMTLEYAPDGK